RLVIIVVRNEILDRVLRKKALHLAVELRGERLIRRQDDRRAPGAGDDMRHRERLARAGHPQEHLIALTPRQPLAQFVDRLRLVAGRLELRMEPERFLDVARRAFGDEQWGDHGAKDKRGRGAMPAADWDHLTTLSLTATMTT